MFFFFFKQKTAYEIKECDWSSDVCSSDLEAIDDKFYREDVTIIAETLEFKELAKYFSFTGNSFHSFEMPLSI